MNTGYFPISRAIVVLIFGVIFGGPGLFLGDLLHKRAVDATLDCLLICLEPGYRAVYLLAGTMGGASIGIIVAVIAVQVIAQRGTKPSATDFEDSDLQAN